MSDRAKGVLAYGYDLGGPSKGWKLVGVEEFRFYNFPDWYKETLNDDWREQANDHLIKTITGFDEKFVPNTKYHERYNAALAKMRVHIVAYGTGDYSGYILAMQSYAAPDWDACVIEPKINSIGLSNYLDTALKVLGVVPIQQDPAWILASYYG